MKIIFLTVILVFSFGCGKINSQKSNESMQNVGNSSKYSKAYQLPSGKEIKINSVVKMDFPNSDSALVMNYETEIPIEDMENLRKEVTEVWSIFQTDVEKAGLQAGVIRVSHFEGKGMIRDGKGHGFLFIKNEQGKWQLRETDKKK